MKRDMVLEIGVENLPASYVAPAVDQLREATRAWLDESRLPFDSLYAAGTPRRLAVVVSGLSSRQGAATEQVTGPPVSKAFDGEGNPTKAAEGFARSHGVGVDGLDRVVTSRGEYLGFRRRLKRSSSTALMRVHFPSLIEAIRFPKTMRWEPSGARFARPVRWIVCLHGDSVVRFRFADVTSGARSYARPWMPGESVEIERAESYRAAIARLGVVLDADRRRERIRSTAARAASRLDLRLIEDEDLVSELAFMVENPRVLVGTFPDAYLDLPAEVVTTAMRAHQRYLAVSDDGGTLVSRFITFIDGNVVSRAVVRQGNEKVLNARLSDARFYWNEDVRRGVEGLCDELDRIVFLEGFGTVGDKRRRIEALSVALNARLTRRDPADETRVRRVARLAKSDVASEMIKDGKEFTKLQGLIGSHYARVAGEDRAVVTAIREHYQPRTPSDRVPRSTLAAVVGAADRIDTICGCFLAGFVPSGSQDPYGLRRLANGLIRIVQDEPGVGLDWLVDEALGGYGSAGYAGAESVATTRDAVVGFFQARCQAFLRDRRVPYDVADAIWPLAWAHPGMALERARAIARLRGDARFERLITGVKRVGNILAPERRRLGVGWGAIAAALDGSGQLADGIGFTPERFDDPAEHSLLRALRDAVPTIVSADERRDFAAALDALSGLAGAIDGYFDGVLVNCDDPETRENRHAFLATAYAMFARYADFSAIVESGGPAGDALA